MGSINIELWTGNKGKPFILFLICMVQFKRLITNEVVKYRDKILIINNI